jgi:hypothetical protein
MYVEAGRSLRDAQKSDTRRATHRVSSFYIIRGAPQSLPNRHEFGACVLCTEAKPRSLSISLSCTEYTRLCSSFLYILTVSIEPSARERVQQGGRACITFHGREVGRMVSSSFKLRTRSFNSFEPVEPFFSSLSWNGQR